MGSRYFDKKNSRSDMKIAILDFDDIKNPLLNAGQARATFEVGKRLVKKGYKVTIIASRYPGSRERVEEGISYKHIGLGSANIKVNNLAYILSLPFTVRKLKADIMVECFTAPISTLFSPLFTKIPVVALPSMFNAVEFSKKYHIPFYLIERFGIKFYKYMLPYSDTDSSKAKKLNPKIFYKIVPQGVGEEYFQIKRKEPKHILFLGRFDIAQKGIDLLIQAYAKIEKQIKYPLVLAGHGPDENKIKKLIKDLNLEDKVTIAGPAYGKKKYQLMSEALFVAFPSRHDEMCLWTLEALAAGLPFVCFDLPESKWINSEISLKTESFNIDEYANLLLKATDFQLNSNMSSAARKFSKQFSWEKVAADFETYFKTVIAKEKKGAGINRTKLSYTIDVPKIKDEASLCFAESSRHIPFKIKRVYYISDVDDNVSRGLHAHKKTLQAAFCIKGSVKMLLDSGKDQEEVVLNKINRGIYMDKMIWHEMTDFEKDTILLIFASEYFDEKDYIRNYQEFLNLASDNKGFQQIRLVKNHIKNLNSKIMDLITKRSVQLQKEGYYEKE